MKLEQRGGEREKEGTMVGLLLSSWPCPDPVGLCVGGLVCRGPRSHLAPAWPAQQSPSLGLSPQPSLPTKGQCPREGKCCVGRIAARPLRGSGRSDHKEVTRAWLTGTKAILLSIYFRWFWASVPKKRSGERGRQRLSLGAEVHFPSQWLEAR